MPTRYELEAPDGTRIIVTNGSERYRLLSQGYKDVTSDYTAKPKPRVKHGESGGDAAPNSDTPNPKVVRDTGDTK